MKNWLLLFAVCLSCTFNLNAQLRYGLEGGLNMSNMAINPQSGPVPTTSFLYAYRAGVLGDIFISNTISLQGGIYYSVSGYNYNLSESVTAAGGTSSTTTSSAVTLNYIHVPLNVMFKKDMGPGTMFICVGPFLGYGINGNEKVHYTQNVTVNGKTQTADSTYKVGVTFGNGSSSTLIALDYGACASIGYDLPVGLFVRLGYDLSLANLSPVSNMGTQTNNCLHFTLGFLIKKAVHLSNFFIHSENKYLPKPYNTLSFP
jgi:hypothetical protein